MNVADGIAIGFISSVVSFAAGFIVGLDCIPSVEWAKKDLARAEAKAALAEAKAVYKRALKAAE